MGRAGCLVVVVGLLSGCADNNGPTESRTIAQKCRFTIARAENPRLVTVGDDGEPLECGNRICFFGSRHHLLRVLPGDEQWTRVQVEGVEQFDVRSDHSYFNSPYGPVWGGGHVLWTNSFEVMVRPLFSNLGTMSLGLHFPPKGLPAPQFFLSTSEGTHLVYAWRRDDPKLRRPGQSSKHKYLHPLTGSLPTRVEIYARHQLIRTESFDDVHRRLAPTAPWGPDERPLVAMGSEADSGLVVYYTPSWPLAFYNPDDGTVRWDDDDHHHQTVGGELWLRHHHGLRLKNEGDVRVWEPDDGHDFLGRPLPEGVERQGFKFGKQYDGEVMVVERLRSETCRIEDRVYLYDALMDTAWQIAEGEGMRLKPRFADGAWRYIESDISYSWLGD